MGEVSQVLWDNIPKKKHVWVSQEICCYCSCCYCSIAPPTSQHVSQLKDFSVVLCIHVGKVTYVPSDVHEVWEAPCIFDVNGFIVCCIDCLLPELCNVRDCDKALSSGCCAVSFRNGGGKMYFLQSSVSNSTSS